MDNVTINNIVEEIQKAKNIIVFTGAGISTSCGIPDFRGEKGLYSFVQQKYNLPYPEAIFNISYFMTNPDPFFDLSKSLLAENTHPSIAHKFVAWLEEKNKISLVVTQNIDMLHQKAGTKKILECHGSYVTAHCVNCEKEYKFDEIKSSIIEGKVPRCNCKGVIKPDVVFFGEQLPYGFYEICEKTPPVDLLLVLGTSLSVQPAAGFAFKIARNVTSVIINHDSTNFDYLFTYTVHGDLDFFSKKLWGRIKNE